jgi:Fic family protein
MAQTTTAAEPLRLESEDDPRRDHYVRIAGTFFAHPDLAVTPDEAQRLWRLDASTCEARLNELLAINFLARTGSRYRLSVDVA